MASFRESLYFAISYEGSATTTKNGTSSSWYVVQTNPYGNDDYRELSRSDRRSEAHKKKPPKPRVPGFVETLKAFLKQRIHSYGSSLFAPSPFSGRVPTLGRNRECRKNSNWFERNQINRR